MPATPGTGYDAALAGRLLIWSTVPGAPLLPSSIATTAFDDWPAEVTNPCPYSVIATSGSSALDVPGVESPSVVTTPSYCEPWSRFISTRVCCRPPHDTRSWKATSAYEESPPAATCGSPAETSAQPDTDGTSACSSTTLGAVPHTRREYTWPPSPQVTIATPSPAVATCGTPAPVPASSAGVTFSGAPSTAQAPL